MAALVLMGLCAKSGCLRVNAHGRGTARNRQASRSLRRLNGAVTRGRWSQRRRNNRKRQSWRSIPRCRRRQRLHPLWCGTSGPRQAHFVTAASAGIPSTMSEPHARQVLSHSPRTPRSLGQARERRAQMWARGRAVRALDRCGSPNRFIGTCTFGDANLFSRSPTGDVAH